MSLKDASEIVASCDCPHCGTTAYLNVMQLGENLVCGSCGETYAAPRAPGARASKTLWGPRAAVPEEAPTATTAEESPKDYLARVRAAGAYRSTRRLVSMIEWGVGLTLILISLGAAAAAVRSGSEFMAMGYGLLAIALFVSVRMCRGVLECIIDLADMAADRNRQK